MVDFQEGHRYADFTESTDKVATYGIAALVAGGIAAKVGLFKGLWVAHPRLQKIHHHRPRRARQFPEETFHRPEGIRRAPQRHRQPATASACRR